MRFDILTLFPDLFSPFLRCGVLRRAIEKGLVEVKLTDIRDHAEGPHRVTDDRPYGGGDGMIMKPEPIHRALKSIPRPEEGSKVIFLTPQGRVYDQSTAWELSRLNQLILICGRYEGIDERIRESFVDLEISIGDYVMSGGELAAMVIVDTVSRLVEGVLGGELSNRNDSFEDGLLEHPHYTRPRVFGGKEVPEVLLSGNHEAIRSWRRAQSLRRTFERRPDLLKRAKLREDDLVVLRELKGEMGQ